MKQAESEEIRCVKCGTRYQDPVVMKRHYQREHGIGVQSISGRGQGCYERGEEFPGGNFNEWARRGFSIF
jgi:hypothetical protein